MSMRNESWCLVDRHPTQYWCRRERRHFPQHLQSVLSTSMVPTMESRSTWTNITPRHREKRHYTNADAKVTTRGNQDDEKAPGGGRRTHLCCAYRRPLLMHPMILFALAAAAWHWLLQPVALETDRRIDARQQNMRSAYKLLSLDLNFHYILQKQDICVTTTVLTENPHSRNSSLQLLLDRQHFYFSAAL
ncbi:unnamed protein product [Ranitomeya imitator]|uniref:Uncharacterized protein n=1 Tax=Ranitomeya imitator TaxID=111125 RepID=A0ABN9MMR5_9NEOB|nr:unnamed protein product [Ranitomeya imitator]